MAARGAARGHSGQRHRCNSVDDPIVPTRIAVFAQGSQETGWRMRKWSPANATSDRDAMKVAIFNIGKILTGDLAAPVAPGDTIVMGDEDRKSTRLNSSH